MAFDRPHVPLATLPGMRERTITISSSGKSFSFTGWKIGWATAVPELLTAVVTTKQFLSFASGGPFQYAIAYALEQEMGWVKDLSADLGRRRDLLCDGLASLGMTVHRPAGTYFVTTDVRPLGWDDGLDFCRQLTERAKVAAIPCDTFYVDQVGGLDAESRALVRWTFTKQDAVLQDALARLDAADLRR
jgi:N-succinyldiaminopimelate aminotransferase